MDLGVLHAATSTPVAVMDGLMFHLKTDQRDWFNNLKTMHRSQDGHNLPNLIYVLTFNNRFSANTTLIQFLTKNIKL